MTTVVDHTPAPAEDAEVRDGWKLVPLKLTHAMLDATCDTAADDERMRNTWAALLDASPKAPAVANGGLEDEIADAIDDSLDMDWTGSIGARAVMKLLRDKGIVA